MSRQRSRARSATSIAAPGQRRRAHRAGLARALLKQPKLLILDEATSALDPLTERLIFDRLLERLRGTTVILSAHRLTMLTGVDRILVLERGRLVEHGTHAALLSARGLYRSSFDQQMRGGWGQAESATS